MMGLKQPKRTEEEVKLKVQRCRKGRFAEGHIAPPHIGLRIDIASLSVKSRDLKVGSGPRSLDHCVFSVLARGVRWEKERAGIVISGVVLGRK